MNSLKLALPLLLLLALAHSQGQSAFSSINIQPSKKGLTLQATVFPTYNTNWAGRFSCNNCNPFEGDQLCTTKLPILCLANAQAAVRPYYQIAVQYTPFAVLDGGFYDGWTGGLLQVTNPVTGSDITSY